MFLKVQEITSVILGLRKFIVMMCLIGIAIWFRLENYISGENMVDLLKNTVIAFFASNSMEYIHSAVKSYVDSKTGKTVTEKEEEVGDVPNVK